MKSLIPIYFFLAGIVSVFAQESNSAQNPDAITISQPEASLENKFDLRTLNLPKNPTITFGGESTDIATYGSRQTENEIEPFAH